MGAFFWDHSGIGLLEIDCIRVLLGAIPFSPGIFRSFCSDWRMNRINGIRFTRNTHKRQKYAFFWEMFGGKSNAVTTSVALLPVGRPSSSQVTSAKSIQFSE